MKVRIKFEKSGSMKFIGHLDIMRYFQKAVRRAGIDIAYSGGFSPHQVMSFASPLGVGITSEGEYMDIEVNEQSEANEASNSRTADKLTVDNLNSVMVEGVKVLSLRKLSEKAKNAMSVVAAADYEVKFREGYEPDISWQDFFDDFYKKEEIIILKKTKKSEKEINIRPLIYDMSLSKDCIFMKLGSGSANNLKPELVLEAFSEYAGFELSEFSLLIHRKELYADLGDEDRHEFVSLEMLGEPF